MVSRENLKYPLILYTLDSDCKLNYSLTQRRLPKSLKPNALSWLVLLFLLLFNVESSVCKHFKSDRANHTGTIIAQKRPWGLVVPEKER